MNNFSIKKIALSTLLVGLSATQTINPNTLNNVVSGGSNYLDGDGNQLIGNFN